MEKIKSEDLKKFSAFINMFNSMYKEAFDNVSALDKLTQDYLHQLELTNTKYSDRAKIATSIRDVRKDRRYWKNIVDCFQPMNDLMATQEQKKIIMNLANTLGQANVRLSSMNLRSYKPKIMPETQYYFTSIKKGVNKITPK